MMFKQFDRRRRNGKIARLPVALRDSVDKMLLAGATYREIVQFLRENDVELSRQAVCNYARQFLCTTQQLRMAQENYKLLLDEMRRTPEMDTSEAIIRVVSNAILNTLASASPEEWKDIKMGTLLREANSLIKVMAHKQRADMLNRTAEERALEGVRAELFSALRDKDPGLFARFPIRLTRSSRIHKTKARAASVPFAPREKEMTAYEHKGSGAL